MDAPCTVLLYYQYVRIAAPEAFAVEQRALCEKLGLKGRILIAEEGINGTVGGSPEAADAYRAWCGNHPLLHVMPFKINHGQAVPFKKLAVKVRKEIVTLGYPEPLDPADGPDNHLSPEEWKRILDSGEEVVLFDVRNDYESAVGRFRDAITPPIHNFRDLPAALRDYEHLKDKKVMMYCTGGIRCEKASALFRREGFREVYQLDGGIISYGDQIGDAHWEGDCFVFDERMSVPVGKAAAGGSVAVCAHTGAEGAELVNCLHDDCHRLFPVSRPALEGNPDFRLCPDCLARGLTWQTADYVGSPARPPRSEVNR
jgi:UPF0176 protein